MVVSQDRYTGYKNALASHHIALDENKVKFVSGFLLEDSSYKISKKLLKQEIDAIVTTDTMVAEGIVKYLKETGTTLPIISFDSVKPKLDIEAYVDVHAIKLGRVAFNTLHQIINDNKENKHICYRRVIPHTIIEL